MTNPKRFCIRQIVFQLIRSVLTCKILSGCNRNSLEIYCLEFPYMALSFFRSTSPTLQKDRALRTRIARTTDPIVVEQRRSRKPRVVDANCQTELIPEFGTLENYLRPPPPPEPEEPKEVNTVN